MKPFIFPKRYFGWPDVFLLTLLAALVLAVAELSGQWRAEFHRAIDVDLSLLKLPRYAFLSAMRGMMAYFVSLTFTLIIGYWAARSRKAEAWILPLIDILQSIPVLGFLPGLVLGLIAVFPHSNMGLELAAILMIFTGQVWNMTFSYYSSLKSVPADLMEATRFIGMSKYQRWVRLELPYSAVNLAWNSVMSMAGGWFFLTVCEAFTLGDLEFRLPGIGSYMAVAIAQGNTRAIISGTVAMVLLILTMDVFIWRPLMMWTQRFRLDGIPGTAGSEPIITLLWKESRFFPALIKWTSLKIRRARGRRKQRLLRVESVPIPGLLKREKQQERVKRAVGVMRRFALVFWVLPVVVVGVGLVKVYHLLSLVGFEDWKMIGVNGSLTLCRVFAAVTLATIWALPVGIWIGTSPRRTQIAQPIIQVLASFPAPMLYPLALHLLLASKMPFGLGSMFLIFLGTQWYILFNVLAGAMKIPKELRDSLAMMQLSRWDAWRTLYIPSVFPALTTGWITAAGGAWNASIVAEYLPYNGSVLSAHGLGATISIAASHGNFPLLAASLTVMVFVVLALNRTLWRKLYHLAENRFQLTGAI